MTPNITTPPRAIAVILGHLGASESTLQRYASWYHARSCQTIAATSPPFRFVGNLSLESTAVELWKKTVLKLRETPPHVPLVVHMFSNGGAFLWEQMTLLLMETPTPPPPESSNEGDPKASTTLSEDDVKLLKSRLASGYLIFDSCPCYIRTVWDTTTPWNQSFPFQGWGSSSRFLYTGLAAASLSTWLTVTASWSRPRQFWSRITTMSTILAPHHIYVYTTEDAASDATAVDQIIEQRRREAAAAVAVTTTEPTDPSHHHAMTTTVYRYTDSGHCRIDRDHPEEYQQMIDHALEAAMVRAAAHPQSSSDHNSG